MKNRHLAVRLAQPPKRPAGRPGFIACSEWLIGALFAVAALAVLVELGVIGHP